MIMAVCGQCGGKTWVADSVDSILTDREAALIKAKDLRIQELEAVVRDMLSGLNYLRQSNSVPYGFGIDRLEINGQRVLSGDGGKDGKGNG